MYTRSTPEPWRIIQVCDSRTVQTVPVMSLAEKAYLELEEQLVTLRLSPGTLVQEKELAAGIGIGRTPVREAIQKLSANGLLKVLPRKGLMVAPIMRSELQQVIEARRVLGRFLVVKACERAGADQRMALEILAGHIERSGSDPESFQRLDRCLDELLESACRNRFLVQALSPLHTHCRRLWYLHHEQFDLTAQVHLHSSLARSVAQSDGSSAIRSLNGIISTLEELIGGLDDISRN